MICKKHNLGHTNFWSNKKGGVIYGCYICDKEIEPKFLKLFVEIMNRKNKGNFHKLKELEPRIFKSKYNKKFSSLKGKIVYYEIGETEEDFFYTEEYIKRKLKLDREIGIY